MLGRRKGSESWQALANSLYLMLRQAPSGWGGVEGSKIKAGGDHTGALGGHAPPALTPPRTAPPWQVPRRARSASQESTRASLVREIPRASSSWVFVRFVLRADASFNRQIRNLELRVWQWRIRFRLVLSWRPDNMDKGYHVKSSEWQGGCSDG